jgi:hypothetical protein
MADIKQPCCHKLKNGCSPTTLHYLRLCGKLDPGADREAAGAVWHASSERAFEVVLPTLRELRAGAFVIAGARYRFLK